MIAIERLNAAGCRPAIAPADAFSIHGLLDQAQRRDMRVTALDVRNSGDTRGGRERVVGYGSFAFEYAHSAQLDAQARRTLLDLSREVIKQAAQNGGAQRSSTSKARCRANCWHSARPS